MHYVTFDALEGRSMLSGDSTPTPVDPAALEAARLAVLAKADQFVADVAAAKVTLQTARDAKSAHAAANATQMQTLITELKSDQQARNAERTENEAAKNAVKSTWKIILSADLLDVKTDSEGETEEEQDADYAKYMDDRAAYREQLEAVETERLADELKWKREIRGDESALRGFADEASYQRRLDERAIKSAERTLKDVFQSDRKILERAMKAYCKLGGDVADLDLPELPTK